MIGTSECIKGEGRPGTSREAAGLVGDPRALPCSGTGSRGTRRVCVPPQHHRGAGDEKVRRPPDGLHWLLRDFKLGDIASDSGKSFATNTAYLNPELH